MDKEEIQHDIFGDHDLLCFENSRKLYNDKLMIMTEFQVKHSVYSKIIKILITLKEFTMELTFLFHL